MWYIRSVHSESQMHHKALDIPEVLADIFRHHDSPRDLSSLARTCRAFKEPALDALWENLKNATPLVRCLPEASHKLSWLQYSFRRPLTRTEWDVLRGYARRIRSICLSSDVFDHQCLGILSNPPTTEPLFPNLRSLDGDYNVAVRLFHYPLPSLLGVTFFLSTSVWDPLDDSLGAFSQLCPGVKQAHFLDFKRSGENAVSDCIRGWQSLEDVACTKRGWRTLEGDRATLDAAVIVHVSRIGCLTSLNLNAVPQLSHVESPLLFPYLHDITLGHTSWSSISMFLSHIRLPAIAELTAQAIEPLSKSKLSSFLESVLTSGASRTVYKFDVTYVARRPEHEMPLQVLGLNDLRPCMTFHNLRLVRLDVLWDNIRLTDSDLLTLASAWPRLEVLRISDTWGWNTTGGITPDGLLQLLQTCPSLGDIALAVDTRGYVGYAQESLGPTLPRSFALDVLDSIIDDDTVSPIAAFFALISLPDFGLFTLWSPDRRWEGLVDPNEIRWARVFKEVHSTMRKRYHEVPRFCWRTLEDGKRPLTVPKFKSKAWKTRHDDYTPESCIGNFQCTVV